MNRITYKKSYRGIISFIKRRFNPKRQLTSVVGVLIILVLLLLLKILNNSITDNIIQIIDNSINYEFSLKEDGKEMLNYGKKILKFPEKALTVFNIGGIDKYPPPIEGNIYKPFGEIKYLDGSTDFSNGLDIIPISEKDPIAIENGLITKVEDKDAKGYFVTIEHEEFVTVYGYLTNVYVKENEKISQGDKIGTLGTSKDGNMYLHFELWVDNSPTNPLNYIDLDRSD